MGKFIELTAADGHKFSAYRADPAGKPRGGLIVIMEIFGVNSHIRSVTDAFAADGYLAIAPAMFDRLQRNFDVGYTPQDIEIARPLMQKM
jgi:carboxymethylenebutenolidase